MTSLMQTRMTVGAAVAMPFAVAVWLLTPAGGVVPSTYVFIATLVIAMALVGLITWDNGLATGSMALVIHDVDVTPSTGPDLASPADGTARHAGTRGNLAATRSPRPAACAPYWRSASR